MAVLIAVVFTLSTQPYAWASDVDDCCSEPAITESNASSLQFPETDSNSHEDCCGGQDCCPCHRISSPIVIYLQNATQVFSCIKNYVDYPQSPPKSVFLPTLKRPPIA